MPLAGNETTTFTETNLITGSADIVTKPATISSGQTIAQYTVLGQVTATGEYIACVDTAVDGSQIPVAIAAEAIDASAAAAEGPVYVGGTFNPDLLVWDASFSAADKLVAFAGTNITLIAPGYSG